MKMFVLIGPAWLADGWLRALEAANLRESSSSRSRGLAPVGSRAPGFILARDEASEVWLLLLF